MSHKLVSLYIGEAEYYTRTDADNVIAQNFYKKWKLRWLELAEKFKEAK